MKIKHISIYLIVILFAFFGCKKDDAPVLTGDIKGAVSLIDGYGYPLQDASGVEVQLAGNDISMEQQTDVSGHYLFEDIPFGNYKINVVKDNYIENILDFKLGHVGGDASTLTEQTMNEIPEFRYTIDSITYNGYSKLFFYFKAIETSKMVSDNVWFWIHCFFSQSPDVSYENFDNSFVTRFSDIPGTNIFTGDWWWWDISYNFLNNYTGTIYCRVYPQVYYEEMWMGNDLAPWNVLPEVLGKPSEVFSFTLDGITRDL